MGPGQSVSKGVVRRAIEKLIELAREKDPPHRIALGMALGIFIGLLPIMGIQMVTVAIIAFPLRANLKAAVAGVWISNPLTFIPLYYGCYRFGMLFTPSRHVDWHEFKGVISTASNWNWSEISASIGRLVDLGADVFVPLWMGSGILAVLFSVPTYFITYRLIVRMRLRKVG